MSWLPLHFSPLWRRSGVICLENSDILLKAFHYIVSMACSPNNRQRRRVEKYTQGESRQNKRSHKHNTPNTLIYRLCPKHIRQCLLHLTWWGFASRFIVSRQLTVLTTQNWLISRGKFDVQTTHVKNVLNIDPWAQPSIMTFYPALWHQILQ